MSSPQIRHVSGDAPYYPVTAQHPARNVRVWVLWAGRRFKAARLLHPKTKRERWAATDADGEVQWLPAPRDAERWGLWPDAWQPERPELWKSDLPETLQTAGGRFWSATQAFTAVDDAEAADLAREMEETRMAAGSRNGSRHAQSRERESDAPKARWWENPSAVAYSAAGSISRREAEGRVLRALALFVWPWWTGNGVQRLSRPLLRDLDEAAVRALAESEALTPKSGHTPLRPLPADQADELTATGWLPVLKPLHRHVLVYLSAPVPVSLDRLAEVLGPSDRTGRRRTRQGAHALVQAALDEVHQVANGVVTPGVEARAARLAAVREGNRAHKRGSAGT